MLLTDITAAEEAAIRQICPLICIKSLRGGNIAAKGNTHCVWQQCNLVTILPNLPGEIKYIIIRRSQNATTSDERTIRSTRFKRQKILALLMLLKATCKPWTDIEIDEDQVNAWPVQGDLVELGNEVQTIIIEYEEQEAVNVDSDFTPSGNNHSHVQLDLDVDDYQGFMTNKLSVLEEKHGGEDVCNKSKVDVLEELQKPTTNLHESQKLKDTPGDETKLLALNVMCKDENGTVWCYWC